MYTSAKILYIECKKLHKKVYEQLLILQKDLGTCTEEVELADAAFSMKECTDLLNDVRKQIDKTSKIAKGKACFIWTQNQLEDPNDEPIRTSYCTATPEVKMYIPFPTKKDKDGWKEFMEYLGVPDAVADSELVRPHYPSMLEHTTKCLAESKPLPPGMNEGKKIALHDLKFRKTKVGIV